MSKLTIEKWEEEGLHMLLDDGVGCLQSKSRRQIERAKEAIEFKEMLEPYILTLNATDNELLAAVMAADGPRTTAASQARTDAVNQVILAYGRLGILKQVKTQGAVCLDMAHPHPNVVAEKRKPTPEGNCPECGDKVIDGFGLMGGGYGPYWTCDNPKCSYLYKVNLPVEQPSNYIDKIADRIIAKASPDCEPDDKLLYRIYALLALTCGPGVTKRDVHDAWSVWKLQHVKEHKSLIPFEQLSQEVQDMDEPYRKAIAEVATELLIERGAVLAP
jgi:hypothetical protein